MAPSDKDRTVLRMTPGLLRLKFLVTESTEDKYRLVDNSLETILEAFKQNKL